MSSTSKNDFAQHSTAPRPFVFVLMPFEKSFDDVYKLGIKPAAVDAETYAERVDEQHHTGSILERVLNQIAKSDVLVADMTGRNANVYYEVGYAHALGKQVILITQSIEDIPFDLKDRPHRQYSRDNIEQLRESLVPRIRAAIANTSAGRRNMERCPIEIKVENILLTEGSVPSSVPIRLQYNRNSGHVEARVSLWNMRGVQPFRIDQVHLLLEGDCYMVQESNPYSDDQPSWWHTNSDEYGQGIKRYIWMRESKTIPFRGMETAALRLSDVLMPSTVRLEIIADGRVFSFPFLITA